MDTRETKCKCPNKQIQSGTLNTNNTTISEMSKNDLSDGHYEKSGEKVAKSDLKVDIIGVEIKETSGNDNTTEKINTNLVKNFNVVESGPKKIAVGLEKKNLLNPTQTGQTSSTDDLFERLSSGQKKLADVNAQSGLGNKYIRRTGSRIGNSKPTLNENDLKSQENRRKEGKELKNKETELAKIFERIKEKKKEQEIRRKTKEIHETKDFKEIKMKEVELKVKEKEGKEVDKNEKVSFLRAMFERKGGQNTHQREKQTPPRRKIRRKADVEVDFKYQKAIDTFLVRKETMETGNPIKAKRKWEENDENEVGTLLTPSKKSRK